MLQYNFIIEDIKTYINNFKIKNYEDEFITQLSISDFENDELTLVCYGGVTDIVIKSAYEFFRKGDFCRIIIFSKLSDINENFLKN